MAKTKKNTTMETKTTMVRMKRIGYEVVAEQVGEEFEQAGIKMQSFKITEVSGSSPHKVGDTLDVSKNELKYHITYNKK